MVRVYSVFWPSCLIIDCRIPLYYPLKTLFLLYLALPQTQGSSYLYVQHLQPFFHSYEPQIDAALSSLKTRLYAYAQETVRNLWGNVAFSLGQPQPQQPNILNEDAAMNRGAPPSLADPVSGPAQLMTTFWSSFGPGIIASGTAMMRQAQTAATASANTAQSFDSPAPSRQNTNVSQAALERRRQLEAELAALQNDVQPYDMDSPPAGQSLPIPPASAPYNGRRSSDEDGGSLRERNASSGKLGKFEEVEIPSDAEGNDEPGYSRPVSAARNTSWFGWGGGAGYERVKND